MRDFLTGLAILVIVALTAATVAPYFIDWNGQRTFLEAQLTRAMGQTVTIGGNIDLKLLPTPYIRLTQAVIGSDDGPVRIGIRHLDLELAVAPLLHGEFDIVEGRFDAPTIRITLRPDRTLPTLPATPALHADLRFDRVAIANGTLAIADPQSGRTIVFDNLDLTGDAPSLAGPFKIAGTVGSGAARGKVRLTTTEPRAGKTHVHATLDETSSHPGLDLDGQLAFATTASDAVRQSFDGKIVANGHVGGLADDPVAWHASGRLRLGPEDAVFEDGEVVVGDDLAPLRLAASGSATFGEAPKADIDLSADQLDVDRLAGPPTAGGVQPPPHLPSTDRLRAALAAITPPLPTRVDLAVATVLWGGEPLRALKMRTVLGGPEGSPLTFDGAGPGGLRASLAGASRATGFVGTVAVASDDLPVTLRWLGRVDPALRLRKDAMPFRTLSAKGRVSTEPGAVTVSDLDLAIDRSTLAGKARLDQSRSDGQPARLTLDLTAKSLDLDTLPTFATFRRATRSIDLDVKLHAKAVQISRLGGSRAEDTAAPALGTGQLDLDLSKTGAKLDLRTLHAENIGGATVDAHGTRDDTEATLSMTVDAPRLAGLAGVLQRLAPGQVSEALASRAASLSPAHLVLDAALRQRDGAGAQDLKQETKQEPALEPVSGSLAGSFAGTKLAVRLARAPGQGAPVIDLTAQNSDGTALLHQLGAATLPIDTIGASRIALKATGALSEPLQTQVNAAFGATQVAMEGQFGFGRESRGGSGTMKVTSPDVTPLLQGLAVAFPDLTGRLPVDLTGGVAVGEVGIGLSDLRGTLGTTPLRGTVKWQTTTNDAPALTGSIDLATLSLASLGSVVLGQQADPAAGAAWSNQPFTAGLVDPPSTALTLHAKTLDLGLGAVGHDGVLDVSVTHGTLGIRKLDAQVGDGHVGGEATVRRDGPIASVEGKLDLAHVPLRLPGFGSVASGQLSFAGSGRSPLALVASLAGNGTTTLSDAHAARADPSALLSIFKDLEADTLAVDEETIKRAFHERATTDADLGTREGGLTMAGGTLAFAPRQQSAPALAPGITGDVSASLNLRSLDATVRLEETLRQLPNDWTGQPPAVVAVTTGPLRTATSIEPDWDVSRLVDAVAARAIARESARIEAYEFDIRERAFFNERLETDRRRDLDRAKAEADAKAAAEAARRAAEAARKAKAEAEAERRAQAAKAAEARKAAEDAAAEQRRREDARPATPAPAPPSSSEPGPQPYELPPSGPANAPAPR